MKYYLPRDYKYKHINDAGSKARMDIERIMEGIGIQPIAKPYTISKNRICHFMRTLAIVMRMAQRIRRDDILVLQYPTKYYSNICRFAHLRGAKVVTFIHDLGCFRQKHNTPQKEMRLMNQSDALIGCNDMTCKWLQEHGFTGYSNLGILQSLNAFDFLSDAICPDRKKTWPLHQIVYAGQLALRKNRFLYEFGQCINNYTVNIYGKGFDSSKAAAPEKFHVKGFMFPNDLIRLAEGDFGLVWDGDSIDCCSGNWGAYLMINTPHKVSLYIRCGLPIIIWKKAAMARFVEENGIGICIDSLHDLSTIYDTITPDTYNRMCDNVMRVSHQMAEGWYFSKAVSEVISKL